MVFLRSYEQIAKKFQLKTKADLQKRSVFRSTQKDVPCDIPHFRNKKTDFKKC
ncbi:hypothetical protein JCM19046_3809 [Bacillus sp. JCM 19046]|nr:hypothetical protein JCM19046_3809 [Bacillus sp. JCM 19046]